MEKEYVNILNNYFCYPLRKNFKKVFEEECKKYGLYFKMSDIVKAYKKENKQDEQLTFI